MNVSQELKLGAEVGDNVKFTPEAGGIVKFESSVGDTVGTSVLALSEVGCVGEKVAFESSVGETVGTSVLTFPIVGRLVATGASVGSIDSVGAYVGKIVGAEQLSRNHTHEEHCSGSRGATLLPGMQLCEDSHQPHSTVLKHSKQPVMLPHLRGGSRLDIIV